MKIAILGTGAYGLALGLMFNKNNCDLIMWTKSKEAKKELETTRENKTKLPNVIIPQEIKFTNSLKDAVSDADLILFALPAGAVDKISKELKKYINPKQHFIIGSKGIEQDTCLLVTEVFNNNIKTKNFAVISGPSFAVDIVSYVPIGLTVATENNKTYDLLTKTLQNNTLKLRRTKDVLGVEICGSIKNVIAIAAGILDGLKMPESTQAMFITESLHDIKNLIKALGGNKQTILSYAGFGDILLTCTSKKSRNFSYGYLIGSKASKEEIETYLKNTTVEGLYTLKSIYKLLDNKKVSMPIIDLIYNIIFNDEKPEKLLNFLVTKD